MFAVKLSKLTSLTTGGFPSIPVLSSSLLVFATLGIQSASAGFVWNPQTNSTYMANNIETFSVTSPGYANTITSDFSVNHDGLVSTDVATPSPDTNKKIFFENANPLLAGDMLVFTFDMNVMIASHMGSTRLAADFRAFDAPAMDIDITLGGGNDSLANYFNYPASIATGTTAAGENRFLNNPGISRSQGFDTTFNGVSGSTASYTAASNLAGGQASVEIVDQDRFTEDFSFQTATYKVTLLEPLPANTKFQWTFGGREGVIDPVGVPEPSRALLLVCSGALFLLRRRR